MIKIQDKITDLLKRMYNCLADDFDKHWRTDIVNWIQELTEIYKEEDNLRNEN